MKTVFQALAKYNKNVNLELITLLESTPADKMAAKTKAFYPTITDAVLHLLVSDLSFLKRFKAAFPLSNALNSNALLTSDIAGLKGQLEHDLKKYIQHRKEADAAMMQFVDELNDGDLNMVFKYTNYKGEAVETIVWKMLLTIFNHETHHRGGVSVMLELEDVKNDYSGTLARI